MKCPICQSQLEFSAEGLEEFYYDCSQCDSSLFFKNGNCEVLSRGNPLKAKNKKALDPKETIIKEGEPDLTSSAGKQEKSPSLSQNPELNPFSNEDQTDSLKKDLPPAKEEIFTNDPEKLTKKISQTKEEGFIDDPERQAENESQDEKEDFTDDPEEPAENESQDEEEFFPDETTQVPELKMTKEEKDFPTKEEKDFPTKEESLSAEEEKGLSAKEKSLSAKEKSLSATKEKSLSAKEKSLSAKEEDLQTEEENLQEKKEILQTEKEEDMQAKKEDLQTEEGLKKAQALQQSSPSSSFPRKRESSKGQEKGPEVPLEEAVDPNKREGGEDFQFEPSTRGLKDPLKAEKEDFSEVAEFARSTDQDKQGLFLYDLTLSEINSQGLREKVLSVLEDESLALPFEGPENLEPMQIKEGKITLAKISPVQAHVIINSLMGLPLNISWEQSSIAES